MKFGQALDLLEQGKHVARAGWNGKGMRIFLMRITGVEIRGEMPDNRGVRPCIGMLDAQQMIVPGWLASQTDLRADDWEEVQ
jgi:hypothetical protein